VKNEVIFDMGTNADDAAKKLVDENPDLTSTVKKAVHPSTLKSWVKGRIAEGDEIPLELFGAHIKRVAKVKAG